MELERDMASPIVGNGVAEYAKESRRQRRRKDLCLEWQGNRIQRDRDVASQVGLRVDEFSDIGSDSRLPVESARNSREVTGLLPR